jgi:ubiquinone/menaquinone biosynthesis C-methylase UbiE
MNFQHYLWMRNFGYYLHPDIVSRLPTDAKIADIGTGTGIFLCELSNQLSPNSSFNGFDVLDAQYPPPSKLPQNVQLHLHDAKEPWPQDFHCQFDAVYLRFLISALDNPDVIARVAENVSQILKPGGAIQWCEIDPPAMKILRHTLGARTSSCNLVLREIKAIHHARAKPISIKELSQIISNVKYQDVTEDWVSSDVYPETRSEYILNSLDLWRNILKMRSKSGASPRSSEEIEAIIKDVESEVGSGAYWRVDVCTVVGFKVT